MPDLSPLFDWRSAVGSKHGPKSPTTRHVLLTLSLWMSPKGDSCFPTTETLSEASALSRRAVEKHLKIAQEEGWIGRGVHGFGGQRWKRYEYAGKIPRPALAAIMAEKKGWEPDDKGREPDEKKVGNDVPINASLQSVKEELSLSLDCESKIPKNWKPEEFEVFEHWLASRPTNGGPIPKPSTAYRGKIRQRLKDGFTPDQLRSAISNVCSNQWHIEHGHVGLSLILKNGEKVDQHMSMKPDNGSGGEGWEGDLDIPVWTE